MTAPSKSSSSISINKLYGDQVINAAELASPLTISGTASVANPNDTYAVEIVVTNSSGNIVDTFWSYGLKSSKSGAISWSLSDPTTKLSDGTYTLKAFLFDTTIAPTTTIASTTSSLGVDTTASISVQPLDADWAINAAQSLGAVTISGATVGVEAGQKVSLKLLDSTGHTVATFTAQISSNGTWSTSLPQATRGLQKEPIPSQLL